MAPQQPMMPGSMPPPQGAWPGAYPPGAYPHPQIRMLSSNPSYYPPHQQQPATSMEYQAWKFWILKVMEEYFSHSLSHNLSRIWALNCRRIDLLLPCLHPQQHKLRYQADLRLKHLNIICLQQPQTTEQKSPHHKDLPDILQIRILQRYSASLRLKGKSNY